MKKSKVQIRELKNLSRNFGQNKNSIMKLTNVDMFDVCSQENFDDLSLSPKNDQDDYFLKLSHRSLNDTRTINVIQQQQSSNNKLMGPSLYGPNDGVEILNANNFDTFVFNNSTQYITLVQFYNFHCPHCQGYVNTFRRFVNDIRTWRPLIRVGVLNCADSSNVQLCRDHEPQIRVPTIKWFAFGLWLQQYRNQNQNRNQTNNQQILPKELSISHRLLIPEQKRDSTSLRRGTIEFMNKLFELSKSTSSINNNNNQYDDDDDDDDGDDDDEYNRLNIKFKRPKSFEWRIFFEPIEGPTIDSAIAQIAHKLVDTINHRRNNNNKYKRQHNQNNHNQSLSLNRLKKCQLAFTLIILTIDNNLILESSKHEYLSGQIVSDWIFTHQYLNNDSLNEFLSNINKNHHHNNQNQNCANESKSKLFVTRTFDSRLAKHLSTVRARSQIRSSLSRAKLINSMPMPLPISLSTSLHLHNNNNNNNNNINKNGHILNKRSITSSSSSLSSLSSSNLGNLNVYVVQHYGNNHRRHHPTQSNRGLNYDVKLIASVPISNGDNYTRENLMNEDKIRWHINTEISQLGFTVPLSLQPDKNNKDNDTLIPGVDPIKIIDDDRPTKSPFVPADDDAIEVLLTDYYKALHQMLELEVLAKAQYDGYQLLAIARLLDTIDQFFPFESRRSSKSKQFIRLIRDSIIDLFQSPSLHHSHQRSHSPSSQLHSHHHSQSHSHTNSHSLHRHRKSIVAENQQSEEYREHGSIDILHEMPSEKILNNLQLTSGQLAGMWRKIERQCACGLPSRDAFEWKFCSGSKPHLRGYTCGLWLTFHTLTVNEYLSTHQNKSTNKDLTNHHHHHNHHNHHQNKIKSEIDLKRIKDKEKKENYCLTNTPELDLYQEMTSKDKFVDYKQANVSRSLASIANFVRFFFGCDNCAGHFSCMFKLHPPQQYEMMPIEQDGDIDRIKQSMLWLWLGHNRVNLRTRNTHSEDRAHPKHIFPLYKACKCCYRIPHNNNTTNSQLFSKLIMNRNENEPKTNETIYLEPKSFHQHHIVNFLIARYSSDSIQHNRINIENEFKPPTK